MNHIYRLVWNRVSNAWVAAAESARGRGKGSSRKLVAAALSLTAGLAQAAPAGGQVASGAGSIDQSGATTTITQSSQSLSLNWQSFNIAKSETVNFVQPSASAIAVNRIVDTNGSQILGQLNANGQVYLINPNGILFGQGAQINVGSLVASTLDVSDTSLSGNSHLFSGNGAGSIVNQGTLNAAKGGYVALLGNTVSNQGTITAPLGTVALGAGNAVTLNFNGNSLVKMQIDQSVLNSLAENGGLIRADGGLVVMNAGAKDALLASVVNNTGVIEARTVENHEGTIILLGGMAAGTVNVGGTLEASAPNGGNGGFIETSAAHVKIANDVKITTTVSTGQSGSWLIDPVDFTIAAIGGDISGTALGNLLASNSITIQTAAGTNSATNLYGTLGSNGDIHVNDAVSWSANNTLTLDAWRNININKSITATGTSGKLALKYGQGAAALNNTASYNVKAPINLQAGPNFSTQLGSDGTTKNYTVITSLGLAGSTTTTDLQGISGGLTGNYVLGANIDASATSTWNFVSGTTYSGFTPIGNSTTQFTYFTGSFDGLGHTISNLTINRPITDYVGLFGYTEKGLVIRNVGLVGGSVIGQNYVGGLVGSLYVSVSGSGGSISIGNSYATGSVSGQDYVGGLVGRSFIPVANNGTGSISIGNSYATGSVSGRNYVGGLLGFTSTRIFRGGTASFSISNSYATSSVSGSSNVGGLVGYSSNSSGGTGNISNSYATGHVVGSGTNIGALVGENLSTVINNFWDSTVNPTLAGIASGTTTGATGLTSAEMQTAASFTGFNFTTTPGATGNNWVMVDADGTLNNASGATGATRPMLASEYSTTINNAHQLQLVAMDLAASYTLGTNVNAATTGLIGGISTDVWGSAGFVSIGNSTSNFTGTFDGLGHTISNLTQSNALSDSGLFSQIGAAGIVKNLGLTGVTIMKQGYGNNNYLIPFGALTGTNAGHVSNVYSTGTITNSGPDYNAFGGLVGVNTGSISNAYSSATLSSGMWGTSVGGLVGINRGTISSSYAAGAVTGSGRYVNVGGLVGQNTAGSIENSYAIGAVTSGGTPSSNAIGGLVGLMSGGAIANAYAAGVIIATKNGSDYGSGLIGSQTAGSISNSVWDTTTSSRATGIGYSWDSQTGVTGLTSSQMMLMASFSSWNTATPNSIANSGGSGAVWRIYEGHTAPLLTSFMAGLTFADAPDVAVTYNGNTQTGATSAHTGVLGTAATGTNAGFYNGYYSNQQGYDISGGNLTINAAALSAISLSGTRAYDGTVDVAASIFTLSGLVSGENLVLTGSGTIANKNVGINKTVTLGSLTLGNGSSGLASNYTFTGGTQTATITKADLAVSGLSATGKVYDANTNATLSGSAAVSALASDVVTLAGSASGVFSDKNVGSAKAVTVSGNTLGGTDAGNYNLLQQAGLSASIGKADLAVSGLSASNKVYDAGVVAGITGSAAISQLGTDAVTLAGTASGVFADKNVGSAKAVTVSGNTLGGTDASNYNLLQQAGLTASISKADLAVSGLTASNKVYDANTNATLSGSAAVSALASDVVTLAGSASGVFSDKNVGSAKAVTVIGNTITGTDAGNYNLLQQTGLSATISKAQLSYTAAPANFLNGQIPNNLSGTVNGFASGDTLANSTSGHLTWTTPANASSKPGSYAVDGNGLLASNYSLSQAAPNSTALTLAPATRPTLILNATTQLASMTASLQASAQPTVLSISPSILVTKSNIVETAVSSTGSTSKPNKVAVANTSMTIGSTGPALQIVNGGMRLPVAMVNVNE
jgi:filamentous hemagglutinin family protein